jgi:hypothetical protein
MVLQRLTDVRWPEGRVKKFRQAAFVYLHVTILYEMSALVMLQHDMIPDRFGPPALWLTLGGVVGLAVFAALYWWQNVWVARVIWFVHGLRLKALINSAFIAGEARLAPGFYVAAIFVVVINMWMLARAGWDL